MYAIVYMFSHQFQVPFFITDYLSVLVPYIFTSFSNTSGYCNCRICVSVPYVFTSFSNMPERIVSAEEFQYHTFLHHSQTQTYIQHEKCCFSTIRFYIILKHSSGMFHSPMRFSTIRFYIILKLAHQCPARLHVSVPYVFTSFSNTKQNMPELIAVSVPYVFTSFSNPMGAVEPNDTFQYHTFLHHSQTFRDDRQHSCCFSTIRFYIILKPLS